MRKLPDLEAVAEDKTELIAEGLGMAGLTTEERFRGYCALSDWYRVLAVCRLLVHADTAAFWRDLKSAGQARRELLGERARLGAPFDTYTGAGRFGPVCAAVAGGADDLALAIARLSSPTHVARQELEEDFAWARLLHGLVGLGDVDAGACLAELTDLLGADAPRVAVAGALARRDARAFAPALEALGGAWAAEQEGIPAIDRGETYRADSAIWVEGLALVRLGARLGLPADDEHPFLPSLARVP